MTTTPLHERPVWVPVPEMGSNRFDPLYYDPTLTVAERHFRAKGTLPWKRLSDVSRDIYSFGAYELTNSIRFVDPGVGTIPFVNVTEIANPFVEYERARHIDRASHELLEKSVCRPGTLLLSMSGSIGRVGVLPQAAGECNSNQHVAKIVIDPDLHDAHFLAVYFSARIGIASCEREAAGAVQKELYLYNISTLPIPDPKKPVRTSIGHKVRAAERLRVAAESSVRSAIQELETALGWPIPLDPSQIAYAPAGEVGKRIDALPYLPRFVAVRNLLKSHGAKTLEQIGATAVNGCESRDFVTAGQRYLIVGDMESWHLKSPNEWSCIPKDADVPDKARPDSGDLLCIRTGPVGYMVSWEPCYGNAVLSSHWIRIRGDEEAGFDAGYMAILSQLPAWQIMMQAIVYGAVQPQISQEDILDVPVPFIGTELAKRCSKNYRQSVADAFRAKKLVQDAIADVENLIDGKLDEDQCLAEGRKLAEEFGLEVP
jgi:type I restriction enzyme S subunit